MMRRYCILPIYLLFAVALVGRCPAGTVPVGTDTFPVSVVDALHHTVTLKTRPQRIISLAPSITEQLFLISAGDRVVADTSYCKYPPQALHLPKIGGYLDPDTEKVLAFKPDLLIAACGTREDILGHMRALGLTVLTVDDTSLDGINDSIRQIGRMVG